MFRNNKLQLHAMRICNKGAKKHVQIEENRLFLLMNLGFNINFKHIKK